MKLKGMVTRTDVEGGHWLLKTEDGDMYQLQGDLSACKEGARVEVRHRLVRDAREHEVAQLAEKRAAEAQQRVAEQEQGRRRGELRRLPQAVDDELEDDRDGDRGELREDEEAER